MFRIGISSPCPREALKPPPDGPGRNKPLCGGVSLWYKSDVAIPPRHLWSRPMNFSRPATKALAAFIAKEGPDGTGRVTGLSIEPDGVFIYTTSALWCDDAGSGTFRADSETGAIRRFYERVRAAPLPAAGALTVDHLTHDRIDGATQYATVRGPNGRPMATLQRRRVMGEAGQPAWRMFDTAGIEIGAGYAFPRLALRDLVRVANELATEPAAPAPAPVADVATMTWDELQAAKAAGNPDAIARIQAMKESPVLATSDGVRMAGTIDLTPTWRDVLPVYLAAYEGGTGKGRAAAIAELTRMADIADSAVAAEKARKAAATGGTLPNCLAKGHVLGTDGNCRNCGLNLKGL